jgi:hypothetical protein
MVSNSACKYQALIIPQIPILMLVTVSAMKLPAAPLKRDLRFAPTSLWGILAMVNIENFNESTYPLIILGRII